MTGKGVQQSPATGKIQYSPPLATNTNSRNVLPRTTQQAQPSTSTPTQIPSNLTFIATFQELKPNYSEQANRAESNQFWLPPNVRNAYEKLDPPRAYHWRAGTLLPIPTDDMVGRVTLSQWRYSCVTVFSQEPNTNHILVVGFDATERSVDQVQEWLPLAFEHVNHPTGNGKTYSSVVPMGDEPRLAAKGSSTWMPQLLPPNHYDYQKVDQHGTPIASRKTSAGLIGDPALLLALAAFSAPRASLHAVLTTSVRPGAWGQHLLNSGRIQERGMIVTIYMDPGNTARSTRAELDKLRNGTYGPFYGP